MFKKTKYRLAIIYFATIVFVAISFSIIGYFSVLYVTSKAIDSQQRRIENEFKDYKDSEEFQRKIPSPGAETLSEIKQRTLTVLFLLDTGILLTALMFGYYFAGKTIEPIEATTIKHKWFITNAAHEIKTPLTVIKTNLEVALLDKQPNINSLKQVLKDTVEEVDNLNNFTNQLLDESKALNSVEQSSFKNLNISDVIKDVIEKLQPKAKEKGLTITSQLQSLYIFGDTFSLFRLFTNLIENSIKYSPQGQKIEVKVTKQKNKCVVEIKDYGIGISQEDLPHIFEPFYRADKSRTNSDVNGHGLGLPISKGIIQKHKGDITVKSVPNEETVFTVLFPIKS